MRLLMKGDEPVTIQIKKKGEKSKALTIYDVEVLEVYNNIRFLFEARQKNKDSVTINFKPDKEEEENECS